MFHNDHQHLKHIFLVSIYETFAITNTQYQSDIQALFL